MPESVIPALQNTLFSGYISEGPKAKEFEMLVSKFLGNDNLELHHK